MVRLCFRIALALACLALLPVLPAQATTLPSGFQEEVVYSGLEEPMAVSFSPDGRVFVAEKAGKVLVFEDLADNTPEVFADLRTEVYDSGDRGIMGMELDPSFPADPYVYVLYTYDAILDPGEPGDPDYAEESKIPRWGTPDTAGDPCPKPAGADVNGCPVSGRLMRLTAGGVGGNQAIAEKELVLGWCQQFISHSVGDLQFDSQGYLYASGGDGAKASTTDHGQFGWPKKNQCGDPPGGIGGTMEPPSAEGGALRTQDLRTPNPLGLTTDPTGLNGSIIRVDPETGEGVPGNPLFGSLDANERRIVAYGFRNPFRFAIDETDEIYVSNVGWTEWEEIDRFTVDPGEPWNSGWPCYEGPEVNVAYQNLGTNLCAGLYAEPDVVDPAIYNYSFGGPLFPGDPCTTEQGAAITGITTYRDDAFPPAFDGALFFADSVRECIYLMLPGEDGNPDPTTTTIFASDAGFYPAIDLEVGPDGDLYYLNLFTASEGGTVRRVSYNPGAPDADLTATPTFGAADPLEVELDASGSTDPDGENLTYDWDLDGDGVFETLNGGAERTEDISGPDSVQIRVRVKDEGGATNVAKVLVHPGNTPPVPQIAEPLADLEWKVGQKIDFAGSASDPQDGVLPDEDLHWRVRLHHCRDIGDCHAHPLQVLPSLEEGSFTAPDHEYPAYLEIILTATDSKGLSAVDTVEIQPRTVDLQIASNPSGLTLSAGVKSAVAPFTVTAIEGSDVGLSAPLTQVLSGETYNWTGWSQGGSNVQNVTATKSTTFTAHYVREGEEGGNDDGAPPDSGPPPNGSVAPRTSLLRHPAKRTPSRTARFGFSANQAGATFRCRLDGRSFAACRSPRTYRNLAPGKHVFRVFAAVGDLEDPSPSVFRWRVLAGRDG